MSSYLNLPAQNLDDNSALFHDSIDTTKQFKFDGSLLTTNSTATLIIPNLSSDTLVFLATTQALTNKTLTAPSIITGTLSGLTAFALRDTSAAFDLTFAATSSVNLTVARILTFDVANGARTVSLTGNLTLANNLTTVGNFALTLTQTATTNITLPTTGTLSTLAGAELFTNKTLSDSTTIIGASADVSKAIKFSLGGATASKTLTLLSSHTNNQTITFPDKAGTIAMISDIVAVVNARYYASSTTISGTLATVAWTTSDYDSNSAMSAGTYTIPSAGKYDIKSALLIGGTIVLNNTTILEIQKNGTVVSRTTEYAGGAITDQKIMVDDVINCAANDLITIKISSSATNPVIAASNFDNYVAIYKVG